MLTKEALFAQIDNDLVLQRWKLRKPDDAPRFVAGVEPHPMDEGGCIFFERYGQLVPQTAWCSLGIHNLMAHEQTGRIFALHEGRFTIALRPDFARFKPLELLCQGLLAETLDGRVDFRGLSPEWVTFGAEDDEEAAIAFRDAYWFAGRTKLFNIQNAPGRFWTGHFPDGSQAIVNSGSTALVNVLRFTSSGKYLGREGANPPRVPNRDYDYYCERVMRDLQITSGTIRIEQFYDEEADEFIEVWPGEYLDYFENPDRFSDEDREFLEEGIQTWHDEERFVYSWYWMSKKGKAISSRA